MTELALSDLERRLLDEWQRDFPLVPRPYAAMAERLGIEEPALLAILARLEERQVLGRVGAVVRPNTVGASTLGAIAVPSERLDAVAERVSAEPEVTHNYEREHRFNVWFVVTAANRDEVNAVLRRIEKATGLPVLDLPLEAEYRIDLGFGLS